MFDKIILQWSYGQKNNLFYITLQNKLLGMRHIFVTNLVMKILQCVPFTIVVEVQNILYSSYFVSCPNIVISSGLRRSIICTSYVTANNIEVLRSLAVVIYKDSIHSSNRTPCAFIRKKKARMSFLMEVMFTGGDQLPTFQRSRVPPFSR